MRSKLLGWTIVKGSETVVIFLLLFSKEKDFFFPLFVSSFFFLSGVDENYSSRSIFVTIQIDRSDVSFRSMLGQVDKSKGKG